MWLILKLVGDYIALNVSFGKNPVCCIANSLWQQDNEWKPSVIHVNLIVPTALQDFFICEQICATLGINLKLLGSQLPHTLHELKQ